mgnify:CR=1 FL=1
MPLYHLERITVSTNNNISTHLIASEKKTEPRKTVDEGRELQKIGKSIEKHLGRKAANVKLHALVTDESTDATGMA